MTISQSVLKPLVIHQDHTGFNYRPQRSWAKVMFLQASVILLTGWVSASVHAGIPTPPGSRHSPWSRHSPSCSRHTPPAPPGADTPPGSRHPPPPGADTPHLLEQTDPPPPAGSRHPPPPKQTPAYSQ